MISFLEGIVAGKSAASAFVNVGGVGFEVGMSQLDLSKLPAAGERVVVHTYLQVREDGMALFGFLSLEAKELFERLITVSGVGPKVALAALSFYEPSVLASHIVAQDAAAVQRVPGIGKKMASRIILELKGVFGEELGGLLAPERPAINPALDGAGEALLSMGFTTAEIELALVGAPENADEGALLQYALKKLGS